VPAEQGEQTVRPVVDPYVPAAQDKHIVAPMLICEYVPAGQALHAVAPDEVAYVPALQSSPLTATAPLEVMYPLAYPVGAVPNTVVSQVE